ncbi:hypothetical protein FFLO_01900 [Filobasidium floriforme]|uniref:Uncharacterized protein n=1 Tax=Filobasidium floriforme TaxID=5210 RepID=A0A8K0JQ51_9TREE|nr:hypothetical protein FFLO_01900 [Filobasidium floriforme]
MAWLDSHPMSSSNERVESPTVDLRPLTVESPSSQEVEAGMNPLIPDSSEEDCWTRPFAGLSSPHPT